MVSNRARTLDVGVVKQEVGVAAERENFFYSQVQIVANQFMSAKKWEWLNRKWAWPQKKTRNTVLFTLKISLSHSRSLSYS